MALLFQPTVAWQITGCELSTCRAHRQLGSKDQEAEFVSVLVRAGA